MAAVRAALAAAAGHVFIDGSAVPLAARPALLVCAAPRQPPALGGVGGGGGGGGVGFGLAGLAGLGGGSMHAGLRLGFASLPRTAPAHALLRALRPVAIAPMAVEPRLHAELLLQVMG